MTLERVPPTTAATVVGAVGAVFLVIAVVALALPVQTPRNSGSEKPPEYDCGNPFSYTTGQSRQGWRVSDSQPTPTTQPGEADALSGHGDFLKSEVCQNAMAPRLGFTTWVLGTGLLFMVILAVMLGRRASAGRLTKGSKITLPRT